LVLILSALVVFVIGAGAVVAVVINKALQGPVASVYIGNSFLHDIRDARYDRALDRLCPAAQREARDSGFVSKAQLARSRGHAVATFDVPVAFDRETLGAHSALGTVTFADGTVSDVTFAVEWQGGSACIADGYGVVAE
jgi:hypothetical protein